MITTCSKLSEDKYELHVSGEELGIIAGLLNSIYEEKLKRLSQDVISHVRAIKGYSVIHGKRIILCPNCSGNGNTLDEDAITSELSVRKCKACQGEGRMILIETKVATPYSEEASKELTAFPTQYRNIRY